ncbi:MAG: hypothetical protein AMXMBFR64_51670 [Myxococcales bacterium]
MNRLPDHEVPTSSFGLPAEPGVAFDLLSDVLLNLVTAARHDPQYRDALMGRALALVSDLEEAVREVERRHPHWWGWAMLTVPDSEFSPRRRT